MNEPSGRDKWGDRLHADAVTEADRVEADCPLCGGSSRQWLFEDRGFPGWRCRNCEHVYISPRPSEDWLMREIYATGGHESRAISSEAALNETLQENYDSVAHVIAKAMPQRGKLLDVGTGYGGFLARAAEDGWQIHGVEPSDVQCEAAQERLGDQAKIWRGAFDRVDILPASMDCIVLLDSIEHTVDPVGTCKRAQELLRPGGCLVLRWPQMLFVAQWKRRLGLPRPLTIGAPIHLHDFNRKSIERLMSEAGFVDVRHFWGGSRGTDKERLLVKLAVKVARFTSAAVNTLSFGRRQTPFLAKVTLGRKPGD